MTTKISTANIQDSTLAVLGANPKISQVSICDSSYTVLDDTAIDLSGGYIKITGSGFSNGATVTVNKTLATSVTFVSSTELRAQVDAQAAGTYVVYVVNTDGSVAIRVNAITYSATPSWVTSSTLPDGAADTAISLSLSATSATTYALQAGSSLPTGLTLAANGLLSGTISGLTSDTTYNFTVVATDAEYQDSPRTFSITISSGDIYRPYVAAHISPRSSITALPFNTDASANNLALTVSGDTKPSTFSPYTTGRYSVSFNGSNQYIQTTSYLSALNPGSSDFTIELWVYPTASNRQDWFNLQAASGYNRILLYYTAGNIQYDGGTTSAASSKISAAVTAANLTNKWHHIALSRSSGTTRLFLDGVQIGSSYVDAQSWTENMQLTMFKDPGGTTYAAGYMSGARYLVGTGLYTSNFAVPTSPPTDITNTKILVGTSNRLIDASSINSPITAYNTPVVSSFVPFEPLASYSTYGSAYFDGTGDYLSMSYNSSLSTAGSTPWTLEAWVHPTSIVSIRAITTLGGTAYGWATGTGYQNFLSINTSGNVVFQYYTSNNVQTNFTSASAITINQWTHIAVVFDGTNLKMFLNGALSTTSAATLNTQTGLAFMTIGGSGNLVGGGDYFVGYMADVRFVRGSALYTTTFAPPTVPLTAVSNTSLLTCQTKQPINNNTFLDNSTNQAVTFTRSGNTTPGSFSPYGENWSNYFDGTGDYLLTSTNTNLDLPGDFTIECWINPTALSTNRMIIDRWATGNTGGWQLYWRATGTSLAFYVGTTVVMQDSNASRIVTNSWQHVAIVRSGTTGYMFVNGELAATANNFNTSLSSSLPLAAGIQYTTVTNGFSGYLSNLHIVKGTAVYTSAFTPSTTPLQPIANTVLLTCQSPYILDKSPNNFTLTKNGDVSIQKFGPFAGVTLPSPAYSAYFDGTGDYLSLTPNSSFAFGTGDFTVECWYYPTSAVTSEYLIDNRNASQLATWVFTYNWTGSNSGTLYWYNGSTALAQASGSTTTNSWNHLCYVRSGTTGSMYINGTRVATQTDIANYGNTPLSTTIGNRYTNTGADQYVKGYLSNISVVNGTARYDPAQSSITVPTSPLTATSGTSLLTCQSNTFVDNSTNNFTITANGNSKPSTFSPYTPSYSTKQAYSPAVHGTSMYFDGTGDYLTSTSLAANVLGTSDFTIDFWVYPTALSGQKGLVIINNATSSGTNGLSILINTGNVVSFWVSGSAGVASTTTVLTTNQWYHIALVRSGSTNTLYLNGVASATNTTTPTWPTAPAIGIGRLYNDNTSYVMTGYIADVRIVKGTAVYTSAFVPPNAPSVSIKNTILSMNSSAGIIDNTGVLDFETVGDAKVVTSVKKFGETALYFDGNGDYLRAPTAPSLKMTGDFTVECWVYWTGATTYYQNFVGSNNATFTGNATFFRVWGTGFGATAIYNKIGIGNPTHDGVSAVYSANNLPTNQWVHVAATRSSGVIRVFINGNLEKTGSADTSVYDFGDNGCVVGASGWDGANGYFSGYISDLRITSGYARYTSSFTVPTNAYQLK